MYRNHKPTKATVASSPHGLLTTMEPTFYIPNANFHRIAEVHNSEVSHHGLHMCKKRLKARIGWLRSSIVNVLAAK